MTEPVPARLVADHLRLAYDDRDVVEDLSVAIPTGRFTVIVGPNACGKSTLLRALARLLTPRHGTVLLDGEEIRRIPTRTVAQRLGILPQQPIAPDGITVEDLVSRGRHPHQRWFRQWSADDGYISGHHQRNYADAIPHADTHTHAEPLPPERQL